VVRLFEFVMQFNCSPGLPFGPATCETLNAVIFSLPLVGEGRGGGGERLLVCHPHPNPPPSRGRNSKPPAFRKWDNF